MCQMQTCRRSRWTSCPWWGTSPQRCRANHTYSTTTTYWRSSIGRKYVPQALSLQGCGAGGANTVVWGSARNKSCRDSLDNTEPNWQVFSDGDLCASLIHESQISVQQYCEPAELVAILGGQLAIRQVRYIYIRLLRYSSLGRVHGLTGLLKTQRCMLFGRFTASRTSTRSNL